MDVLVLVSLREGFPNVVLEAGSMGVPAIVSDATGTRDSVVDGVTGYVVPVKDTESLADALNYFAQNPAARHEAGVRARERVLAKFRSTSVWASRETLLRDLVAQLNDQD